MGTYTPLASPFTRVFLTEGRARPDHAPVFKSCMRAGAIDWGQGDITKIECPDPNAYNDFIEAGEFQGSQDRMTTDVQGRFAADEASTLMRLAAGRCTFDIQVHIGACTNPSDFDTYTKVLVYEDARITNYGTDELGTLSSDGAGEVNETADLSAESVYEVLPLSHVERGGDAVVNPIVDVVICDSPSCGDCDDESTGCKKIYAVDDGATGSPGTAPDVVYSVDGGVTWAAEEIDSLDSGEAASAIACVGIYVVVASNADAGIHYKEKANLGDGVANSWTRFAATIAATGEPNDMWGVGTYIFMVGDLGYVYGFTDPGDVIVLDAGIAATLNLNAVHALDDQFAVAVGATDTVIFTQNQTTWGAPTSTPGGANYISVWAKNEKEWWVGDDAGALFYTLDGGVTWSADVSARLPGTGWTAINDIQFPTDTVGFIVADKDTTPRGFELETINGGVTWTIQPPGSGALPLADSLVALATCPIQAEVNFVVAVGTGDDAADGIIIVGQD